MADDTYEQPTVTVLGSVSDMTMGHKPGIYFDMPFSAEGSSGPPSPGAPGTVS